MTNDQPSIKAHVQKHPYLDLVLAWVGLLLFLALVL